MKPWAFALLLAFAFTAGAGPAALPASTPPMQGEMKADAFFDPHALHVIHIKLTKKAWDEMQPTRKGLFSGWFAPEKPAAGDEPHESPFGYQYTFVHGAIEVDGKALNDIGVRFKGNSSYMTGSDLKKPFKVSFNRYNPDISLAGLAELNLNNNAMDPTLMREAISYQFFRDAGVTASRAASALVYESVEGRYDKKLAGFYTVVEEIDKTFLKAHFGNAKGLLLKPEGALDLPYRGDDFEHYKKIYRPKTKPTPETSQRFVDFIKLIHHADDKTFDEKIDTYLDMPAFLRFVAANAMLANMDSILSTGHNFYLYVHPDTLKIYFIPWDLNLSFGGFDWVGSTPEQTDLSLMQPCVKPNHLIERVLKIERFARAYREEARRINQACLNPKRMNQRLADMEALIAKAEKQANVPHKPLPKGHIAELDIKVFNTRRFDAINAQLDQGREGYAPYWSKGIFGGFDKRPPKAATKPATRPADKEPAGQLPK